MKLESLSCARDALKNECPQPRSFIAGFIGVVYRKCCDTLVLMTR